MAIQCLKIHRAMSMALFALISLALLAGPVVAQPLPQEPIAAITSPVDGQELFGIIRITGSANHPEFDRYEIAYGPDPNPNDAWQPFSSNSQPVSNDVLGLWDTTAVADGTYVLRLRVVRKDSNYQEAFIRGLRVVNQQAQATPTPVGPEPTFPPEATVSADSPTPGGDIQPTAISTVLVEQPPTTQPVAATGATPTPAANRPGARSGGASSLFDAGLLTSTCLSGVTLAFVAFGALGVIQLSRSVYRQALRAQRKKSKQHADSQSTLPPPSAG